MFLFGFFYGWNAFRIKGSAGVFEEWEYDVCDLLCAGGGVGNEPKLFDNFQC